MNAIFNWLQDRLGEWTTWVAIFGCIGAFTSVQLTQEQMYWVGALGIALFGAKNEHFKAIGDKFKRKQSDENETLDDLIDRGRK